MTERNDHILLREYAETGSEPAFAVLVERYLNLVHSAALRRTGNPHAAAEIAQAVFIILARKAGKLNNKTMLSGWLYQTAQLTAANYLRGEIRRQRREREAYMQSTLNEPSDDWAWRQIAPQLEEAMAKLGERDRNAIVLRFFENKSLAEVGAALGANEDAAKMRVNRALEKLKKIFNRRGVALTTVIIAGAVSANSVHAAPAGLAKTISSVALVKGATAGGTTLSLVKGALKIMGWNKIKFTIGIGIAILLASGGLTIAYSEIGSNHLAALRILKGVEARYASFTSCSYNAKDIFEDPGMTNLSTFSVRLARPCLYRSVSKSVLDMAQTNKSAIWSTGDLAYFYSSFTNKLYRKKHNLKGWIAQMGSLHLDKTLPTCIPTCFFFNPDTNNILRIFGAKNHDLQIKMLKDGKIGEIECHRLVVTLPRRGLTLTMWIGKTSFLIYRTEQDYGKAVVTSKHSYPGVLEETYEDISTNIQFAQEDFMPKVPNGLILSDKFP